MGIRILNYLDDWLILAQSEDEPLSHRSVLLCHLEYLELRVNFAKGTLSPSKLISFLGTFIDSARMSAVVTPERALAIQQVAATSSSSTCLVFWMPPCQGEPTPFRQSEQLFVCFGGRIKGSPFTKQRLSRWKIDAIMLAYFSLGQQCPMGVRAHLTRGITSSWALSSGVSIAESEAEPHRPHLPGFIIWKFRPYRPGSFLYNGLTLVIWQTSMGVCLLLVQSWPSIELRGCTDLCGTITQGRVDFYEFDPIILQGFPVQYLVPLGTFWFLRQVQVLVVPLIDTARLYWFP